MAWALKTRKKRVFLLLFVVLAGLIHFQGLWHLLSSHLDEHGLAASSTAVVSDQPNSSQATRTTPRDNNKYGKEYKVERIQLGQFVGQGMVTVVFDVVLDPLPPTGGREYVIKFTGDFDRLGEYHPEFADEAEKVHHITADILPPAPFIPQTIWYRENVTNPFKTGLFPLPDCLEGECDEVRARLLNSTRMSISIVERLEPTHMHYNGATKILDIPDDKVACFWKRLFEIMDYIHTRNVRWIDTAIWNIVLSNGEMAIIDWHCAHSVRIKNGSETTSIEVIEGTNKNKNSCPETDVVLADGEQVHTWDANTISKRIREFLGTKLDSIRAKQNYEIYGLVDLQRDMSRYPNPPSFGWLLANHPYFKRLKNITRGCNLTW